MDRLINNLLPSCEKMLKSEIEAFEAKHGIRRKSAVTRLEVMDAGEFLDVNVRILIRGQGRALLATHLKWLSILFITYLPGIYGRGDSRILLWREKYRVTYNSPISQLVCGRRYGKTETMSIFVAGCLVSLRGENWILMSASGFCSETNLAVVKAKVARLLKHYNMPLLVKKNTVDTLIFVNYHGITALRNDGYGDHVPESTINDLYLSHPQYFSAAAAIAPTDKASRGQKGNVWIDENLFVPDEAQTAVAPLITEGDRIMAMTCSKNEHDKSRKLEQILTKKVENGDPTVNALVWSKKCAKCEPNLSITSCPCPKPKPSWLAEDVSFVRSFLEIVSPEGGAGAELDNESALSNEIPEFTADDLLTYDHPQWIYPNQRMPHLQWIVVATDPSGGKHGTNCSKFVTFLLGVTATHDVIILDGIVFPNGDFTNNAERTILRLEALRRQPFATSATIILAPENNMYHYTDAMNNVLMRGKMFDRNLVDAQKKAIAVQEVRLCNYITYRMKMDTLGVITTSESKTVGTNKLHNLVTNHRLFVWENMGESGMNEWKTAIEQMSNWCMTPNKNGTWIFGANGLKTDHIMSLIVGVYAIWNWTEGKAEEISKIFESTCCLCNCATGLCGRRIYTPFVHRV